MSKFIKKPATSKAVLDTAIQEARTSNINAQKNKVTRRIKTKNNKSSRVNKTRKGARIKRFYK